MPVFLAFDSRNPLLWAVLIGWILTVVLHEFAHGIIAYWGGDYTIRERGGLTLNPLQYVDPVMSLLLPIIFLVMGGIPLPGGATYVRRDLLRNRFWDTAVSLAGPAMNFVLFILFALPLHPRVGWLPVDEPISTWNNAQIFLAALSLLQLMACIFNLVPVPPLDGFHAVEPYLPRSIQQWAGRPAISMFLFFAFFMAGWRLIGPILYIFIYVLRSLGFGDLALDFVQAYRTALG